ncbi:hypothetical protein ES707_19143 [subsurface metagenome]
MSISNRSYQKNIQLFGVEKIVGFEPNSYRFENIRMSMTPRERMLTAYRHELPDRVPVSPEIWDATAIAVSGRPFHELIGPFTKMPWWQTQLRAFEYFDCDAWIIASVGESPRENVKTTSKSEFIDKETIETDTTYRTPLGDLHMVSRTTPSYGGWAIEHPVKNFPDDMQVYEQIFFKESFDGSAINKTLQGVGEKGLVTPMVGELFTSFLGSVREGGMVETIYDLCDHEDYCRELHRRYVEYVIRQTEFVLEKTRAQAIFAYSGYSGPPIVSPDMYRRWDKPVLEAIGKICREKDVPLHLHQHGHLLSIIEDIIDAGINVVCPLLPPPQGDVADLGEVKKLYGDKIVLKGNVDPIKVLLNGTPGDVEREVRNCISAAARGGGFILGTADSTVAGTPFENIHAFARAGKKYGKYPSTEERTF